MNELEKYKEIMGESLNYYDLSSTEKYWYLHFKDNKKASFDDVLFPFLEEGVRVWEKGILYQVVSRDGWDISLTILEETKNPIMSIIIVDEREVSYSKDYVKKKRKFVLDNPTVEEVNRLNTVFKNELEAKKSERSKGKYSLEFRRDTIGEKVHEVIQAFSGMSLLTLSLYTRSQTFENILRRVVFKNSKENIEIDWDDFPRSKRQEFINLPLLGNVSHINDYFETRYIYTDVSLKEYLPKKEEAIDDNQTVLQEGSEVLV